MNCSLCNGPLTPLGRLGDLHHYRCRDCGADNAFTGQELLDLDPEFQAWLDARNAEDDAAFTAHLDTLTDEGAST